MTKKKIKGVNVTVSPKLHKILRRKGDNMKPRHNLREYLNITHGLKKDD